jgi:8-hydroxy-5-deazaflavin:NADPH oxidoreductase
VFAVPWEPVKELLPTLGDLRGKLLIDPMIAKPKIIDGYPFPPDIPTSTAEQLQTWAPRAHVVKAFITISYKTLADPVRAGGPISIPFAGADRSAKERVAQLISELGLDPMDTGPLVAARYIENVLWFEVACNRNNKRLFELYMRHVPA